MADSPLNRHILLMSIGFAARNHESDYTCESDGGTEYWECTTETEDLEWELSGADPLTDPIVYPVYIDVDAPEEIEVIDVDAL